MRRPKFEVHDPEKEVRDATTLRVRYRDQMSQEKNNEVGMFVQQQQQQQQRPGGRLKSALKMHTEPSRPESFKPSQSRPIADPILRHQAAQRRLKAAKEEYGKVETSRVLVQWLRQRKQSDRVEAGINRKKRIETWFAALTNTDPRYVTRYDVATKEDLELPFLGFGLIDSRDDLDRLFADNDLDNGTADFEQFVQLLNSVHEDRITRMIEALDSIFEKVTPHKSFSQQYDIHRRSKFMAGIIGSDLSKTEKKQFIRTFRAMAARIPS